MVKLINLLELALVFQTIIMNYDEENRIKIKI